ncbi:MAG: sugar transferase [Planctomycetes bacterium]|nr:sugar transferase [Planctomycetota bacterium]
MNLIIIHKNNPPVAGAKSSGDNATLRSTSLRSTSLLRFALANEPIAGVVLDGLSKSLRWGRNGKNVCAIPEEWNVKSHVPRLKTVSYTENVPIFPEFLRKATCGRATCGRAKRDKWFVISNGRFATQIDSQLLNKLLVKIQADIVAVNVEPDLLGKREKMRLTAQGKVAGFRRLYCDSAELFPLYESSRCLPVFTDWPHHLFVKTSIIDQLLIPGAQVPGAQADGVLPQSFSALLDKCLSNSLRSCGINIGGAVLDLGTQDGLLNFCRTVLNSRFSILDSRRVSSIEHQASDSRLVGKVLLGKNVCIGPKTIVVGPTIIGDNVKIKQGAVINSSIIGPKVSVPQNKLVQNCIVKGPRTNWKLLTRSANNSSKQIYYPTFELDRKQRTNDTFRTWPRFSYAGSFKRIADCFVAIIVIILFAPIIPFIALATKLTSPGPVFFKHRRQGLYGKTFNCIKFRTMHLGADEMQDKLRFVSRVDGPQFKMTDDPRISAVGRFLRETYLDEIPQFINVLLGQMSVVGPRPSPESENTLCPFWRDARLSVRPGITGLWQIFRTRQPMKDFQEWIHYDTEYVRNMSLKMDLWICWKTTKKLFDNFINQF